MTARLPRVPRQLVLQGVIPDPGPDDKSSSRIQRKSPAEAGLDGVPRHSELEPSGGFPHRLGWASEAGGVTGAQSVLQAGITESSPRLGQCRYDLW